MTEVIGQAWIEVLGKTAQFGPDLKRQLTGADANRAAAQAGEQVGTVVGKAIGKALHPLAGRAADDYGREFSRKAKDHGISFGKLVGAGITAGLGIDSIQAIASKAFGTIRDASDLSESQSKNVAVFHESAKAVEDFANDSRRNLLLTKQDAIEASATFGNLFVSLGIANKPAADLSTRLVGLAEDLSSFNNVGTDEALEALRSGLLGEAEPLRKFGVTLSEARIQAEAFALGIAKPVKDADGIAAANVKVAVATANLAKVQKEHGVGTVAAATAQTTLTKANKALNDALVGQKAPLTAAQKAQAAYSIIVKDTATAQGDASRTSEGFANKSRILHKNLGDLSAQIGTALLPRALELTDGINDLVVQFENGTGTGGEIRTTLQGLGQDAKAAGDLLRDTVVPVVKFFADHPHVFKLAAEGMAAYAIASKAASIWNARLAVSMPVVAAGTVATAAAAPAAATGIGAVGAASTLALGPIAAMSAALIGVYEVWKTIKGLQEDQEFYKSLPNTYDNLGTNAQRMFDADPDGYIATHKGFIPPITYTPKGTPKGTGFIGPIAPGADDSRPGRGRNSQGSQVPNVQTDEQKVAASKTAADKAAAAAKYAADQYAANQERQAKILEASQEAVQARFDATEQSLQRQSDAIERQIGVLENSREKILDFRRDVFSSTTAFTALTSLASDPSRATAAGIVGSLQARVGAEKLFTKNIATLGQRGLDKGVLAELVAAGPENRGIASALAAATPSQISALNAAEKQSRAQAQALAATATMQQFGPQALANLQRGLATQNRLLASVDARLAGLPKQLQQALKDDKTRVTRNQKTAVTK